MPSSQRPVAEAVPPMLLSPVENLVCQVEERFNGAGRVALVLHLEGWLEEELLTTALARVQHQHPKLRAVIETGTDKRRRYRFVADPPPIPFTVTDVAGDELPWREEAHRLLQMGFSPAAGPLAAVAVVRDRGRNRSLLVVTAHHAIADGLSAIALADSILDAYASAEQRQESAVIAPRPVIAVNDARFTGGWGNRGRLARRVLRLWREDKRFRWTPLPEARTVPPQTQWVHWVFSKEETLGLVTACRKRRVSLSGALFAAICCGLMECLPDSKALFKCKFPIDLRAQLGDGQADISALDLGCFVSFFQEYYAVQSRPEFWTLARQLHDDLQTFVAQQGPAFVYNMSKAVTKVRTPTQVKRGTLLATNYGVVSLRARYGGLRPRSCTLIFKNDTVGPSLVMEALTLGLELNVGLAAFDLEPAFWDRLQEKVRGYLQQHAGSTTPERSA